MANDLIPVKYTNDNGVDFVTRVNAEVYNQATVAGTSDLGGPIPATFDGTETPLPSSVKPRRVYMKNPSGKGRYVIALTPTARIAATPGATLSIEDSDGAATTYTRKKLLSENFGRSPL